MIDRDSNICLKVTLKQFLYTYVLVLKLLLMLYIFRHRRKTEKSRISFFFLKAVKMCAKSLLYALLTMYVTLRVYTQWNAPSIQYWKTTTTYEHASAFLFNVRLFFWHLHSLGSQFWRSLFVTFSLKISSCDSMNSVILKL